MSLLGNIKEKALKQAAKLSEEKLGEGVTKLLDNVDKAIPGREGLDSDSLTFGISIVAEQGLKTLRKHEDELKHLGEWGVTALLAELGAGNDRGALLVFLQEEAGWDEIFDTVDVARTEDVQGERDYRARVAAFKTVLKDVAGAAKALLPFVLGAVGL